MATLNDGSPESDQRGMSRYCDYLEARVSDLEARLAEYRALYRWFGQDDMTDGRFVTEFERIYIADRETKQERPWERRID